MITTKSIKQIRYYSGRPSFWDGLASLFDIHNARNQRISLTFEDDIKFLKSDFDLVGYDLWQAIGIFNNQNEKLLKQKAQK